MPKTLQNNEFWIFLMIERRLTLWPMVSCKNGRVLRQEHTDFPARLPALFLRPPTAAIYSDPRWKLVKGFRLHRYVAISFCIVAPGQFPRSAFARKRPSGCGGRRVIGSGGERGNQRRNCSRSWSTLTEDCTILSNSTSIKSLDQFLTSTKAAFL